MFRLTRICQILMIPLLVAVYQYRNVDHYRDVFKYEDAFSDLAVFAPGQAASRKELERLRTQAQQLGDEIAAENSPVPSVQKEPVKGAVIRATPDKIPTSTTDKVEDTPKEEAPAAIPAIAKPKEELPKEDSAAVVKPREDIPSAGQESRPKDAKPTLVLHIGSPKTATTSLQMDLTHMMPELESDGYHYTGRWLNPYRNDKDILFLNRTYEPIVDYAEDMFAGRARSKEENIALFHEELAKYAKEGKDVIVSEEGLCGRYKNQDYYEELKEIVGSEWNVLIIAGYRYFHQWLPSAQFQKNRMDQRNDWKITWPAFPGVHEGTGGKIPEEIFPDLVHTWEEKNAHFTKNIVEHNNGVLPLKIYNVHDKTISVRSQFMCNMLPYAVNTCKQSKQLDANAETTTMNLREDIVHTSYDMITLAAAGQGLIDMDTYLRKDVREAAHLYNEEVLKQTYKNFELNCPSEAEYEAYLQESLDHERAVYGEDVAATMEAAHRQDFEDKVNSNEYCNVDAEAVIEHKEWKDFFGQYSKVAPN